MRRIAYLLAAVVALTGAVAFTAPASQHADEDAAPIFGIKIPPGYRDWGLISVAHEAGNLNDLRAVLGNDVAIKACREGKLPFPDGTIIARLAWSYVPSEENNKVFGRDQSFVAGSATNVQFMVKDSKKYAATGGWGFAQFKDGKPDAGAALKTCFPCHEPVKARDLSSPGTHLDTKNRNPGPGRKELNMKTAPIMAVAVLIVGCGLAVRVAQAQQPGVKRTDLQKHDLSIPGREVVQARVELDPGVQFPKHWHPGEEIIYVLEGTLEYQIEGQPPVTLKAGDVLFVPARAIHTVKNVGSGPGAELGTYVVEKGKPLLVVVK